MSPLTVGLTKNLCSSNCCNWQPLSTVNKSLYTRGNERRCLAAEQLPLCLARVIINSRPIDRQRRKTVKSRRTNQDQQAHIAVRETVCVCVCVASCALIYFHRSNWLALSNYLDAFYPKWENNVPWRTINFQFLWLRSPIRCYAFPHSILQRWRKGIHSETKWEPMTAKFGCIWVSFSSSFFFHNSHYFLSFFLFF